VMMMMLHDVEGRTSTPTTTPGVRKGARQSKAKRKAGGHLQAGL
jgi:hypothetical protein